MEPLFITTRELTSDSPIHKRDTPCEYFTFWYVGQIPHGAIHEEGTGMPNESTYVAHLLTIDEALEKLRSNEVQCHVLDYAWKTWQQTIAIDEQRALDTTVAN